MDGKIQDNNIVPHGTEVMAEVRWSETWVEQT
jgi:hypothetical protein